MKKKPRWKDELDDILIDVCENPKCQELADHKILKRIVKERLEKLLKKMSAP